MKRTTLKTVLRDRRLSVRELSRMTNGRVSPATISRIANRTTRPLAEHIDILNRVLGVELSVQPKSGVSLEQTV